MIELYQQEKVERIIYELALGSTKEQILLVLNDGETQDEEPASSILGKEVYTTLLIHDLTERELFEALDSGEYDHLFF